jgi:hypothetical protein
MLMDEVKVDLHVLRALMLHSIGGEVDRIDIVAADEGGVLEGAMELLQKLAEQGDIDHDVGHNTALSLSAGARDNGLSHDDPSDEVSSLEHNITESVPTHVGAASLVSISVDHELRRQEGRRSMALSMEPRR